MVTEFEKQILKELRRINKNLEEIKKIMAGGGPLEFKRKKKD